MLVARAFLRREGKPNSPAIEVNKRLYKNFLIRLIITIITRLNKSIVTTGK